MNGVLEAQKPLSLIDWMVNAKNVRGSMLNDDGKCISQSSPPKMFNRTTRCITLTDGTQYVLPQKTCCKALGLDKRSEAFLLTLQSEE